MDYYYDILLNLEEQYFAFYEWDSDDNIEFIKKIPVFHIDSKTLTNMVENVIKIEENILLEIENKTKLKQNTYLKYTALFSDGKNSLAIEFNDEGISINKSSLLLEDEININEFMYNVNVRKIKIDVIKKNKLLKETRQDLKIKKIITMEIETMYAKKEFSKLKYLYLEWFLELENNIEKMKERMLRKLNEKLTEREYEIYELIKLSYNNV